MGYQLITLMGNLTDNVKVRQVGQAQVAQGGVAVTEKFRKQDGTIGENTEFFDIEIWNKPSVNQYLVKGTPVLAVGKVKTENWQDQQGQNHSTKKIRVETIQLCGGRPQTATAQRQPQAPPQQYQPQPAPAYQQYAPAPAPTPAPAPAPQYQQPVAPAQAPAPAPAPLFPNGETEPNDLPFSNRPGY